MDGKQSLEEQVVLRLKEQNFKVSFAESCTGGLLAGRLVNVSGASDVFEEGYVTYANKAKEKLLGVSVEALRDHGAVSTQVARQMALGAAAQSGAQAAVGITGIAGPDGGTPEKPVGLVYIGCVVNGDVTVTENHFTGGRAEVRSQAVEAALKLLLDCLLGRTYGEEKVNEE